MPEEDMGSVGPASAANRGRLSGGQRLERLLKRRPDAPAGCAQPHMSSAAPRRALGTGPASAVPVPPPRRPPTPSPWAILTSTYDRTHGWLFILLLVGGVALALAALAQGQDLVTTQAENGRLQAMWLALSLLWLGLQAWFWMRRIVEVDYGPDRMEWGPARPLLEWAPRLVGGAPLLTVAGTFIAYRLGGFRDLDAPRGPPLVEVLLVVFCLGYAGFVTARSQWGPLRRISDLGPWWLWPAVAMLGAAGLLAAFTCAPVELAQALGPAAVVFFGVAAILPPMVAAIQVTTAARVPVIPALLGLALVFNVWTDGQHAVGGRLLGARPPPLAARGGDDRPDLEAAFAAWSRAQAGAPKALVVVATEGGASRAGVWTATALQRLNAVTGGALARRTFAISSISGGSVGAVGWAASLKSPQCPATHDAVGGPAVSCLDRFAGADALSPALAGMLFPDLVQRFLPLPVLPDRARALESAWEAAWRGAFGSAPGAARLSSAYRDIWRPSPGSPPWIPFVVVGGASEETGRRILTTPVRLTGAFTQDETVSDIYDLYGRDVAASTAILDGARFPWISPAGRLDGGAGVQHIVDGGYFDGSGVLTARALLDWVAVHHPGLPLVLVTIRYQDAPAKAARGQPWRLANDAVGPFVGAGAARGALQAHFGAQAHRSDAAVRELPLVLTGMACEGLPLNWMLSRPARRYVASLGADDTVQAQIAGAAAAVLAGDPAPAVPVLKRDRFACAS